MYKVIVGFADIQDDRHIYNTGDEFPRKGVHVDEKRLIELSTDKNRRGIPLIEKIEPAKKPVSTPKQDETAIADKTPSEDEKPVDEPVSEDKKAVTDEVAKTAKKKPNSKRTKKNAD